MSAHAKVSRPPEKPVLIFDGKCNFCRFWIARWHKQTGDSVEYIPFQDSSVRRRFPEIPEDAFHRAVQLVETDGLVYGGAEAALRPRRNTSLSWAVWIYYHVPGARFFFEAVYSFIAAHRGGIVAKLNRVFFRHQT